MDNQNIRRAHVIDIVSYDDTSEYVILKTTFEQCLIKVIGYIVLAYSALYLFFM